MAHLRASQPTVLLRVHRAALIREECRSVRLQIRLGVGQRRLQLGDARVRLIERRRYMTYPCTNIKWSAPTTWTKPANPAAPDT